MQDIAKTKELTVEISEDLTGDFYTIWVHTAKGGTVLRVSRAERVTVRWLKTDGQVTMMTTPYKNLLKKSQG